MKKMFFAVAIAAIANLFIGSCSNDTTLDLALKVANRDMPMVVDEGITVEKVVDEDNYVVYITTIDEDLYDMDELSEMQDLLKLTHKEELQALANDKDFKEFSSLCKKCNKGISYRYVGNQSGITFSIDFEPYEF